MGDVEKAGLLKMDFLGLRNLTILDLAVRLIERTRGESIDLNALPLDDQETYALLQRGETKGVFQLESPGIRDLLIKMKPDVFTDIIATNALYRPGPLNGGMVDAYVNRKHKREEPDYPHPTMREVLEETYGVMVYQEQVMRILNRLGGIELSQAYACIKAISKKKTEFIAQARAQFLAGAAERKVPKETAAKVFDLIVFFGGYGFNKSHSTAYALLAFQTAYLKAHYPTEFMAALLSSEIDGAERDKLVEHIDECRRMKIEVLRPDINLGSVEFQVAEEGKIAFALSAIKGVGQKAVEAIVAAREAGGPFASLDDLFERVPLATVTQACVEALDQGGRLRRPRGPSQPVAGRPAPRRAGRARRARTTAGAASGASSTPSSSNGSAEPAAARQSLPDIPELPDAERLAEEKKVLGFYMSSHPLTRHAALLQALATHRVEELGGVAEKSEVILGGMISGVQVKNVQKSRSGLTRMAKLSFEDLTGTVPSMLWPEEFAKHEDLVKNDLIGFVKGTLDRRRDPAELIISQDHPPRARPRRALARGRRPAPQGGPPGGRPRTPAPPGPGPSGQPRPLPGDPRPDPGPSRHLQGRRLAEGPPRRRPARRPRGGRRRRQRPPARPPRGDGPRRDDGQGHGRRHRAGARRALMHDPGTRGETPKGRRSGLDATSPGSPGPSTGQAIRRPGPHFGRNLREEAAQETRTVTLDLSAADGEGVAPELGDLAFVGVQDGDLIPGVGPLDRRPFDLHGVDEIEVGRLGQAGTGAVEVGGQGRLAGRVVRVLRGDDDALDGVTRPLGVSVGVPLQDVASVLARLSLEDRRPSGPVADSSRAGPARP